MLKLGLLSEHLVRNWQFKVSVRPDIEQKLFKAGLTRQAVCKTCRKKVTRYFCRTIVLTNSVTNSHM